MRISEIQLLSNDLPATLRFYADLFGFENIYQDDTRVSFSAGASVLTFIKSDKTIPVYHFAFNIPPHTLDEALRWTRERVPIVPVSDTEEIADFVSWNAKAFYFKDNNANILEFIARFNLPDATTGAFDCRTILSISEIGIVVDDVPDARQHISREYDIPLFSKPPLHDNFAAMGNDEGLLILSETGREWYATHIKAESAWSRISIESAGRQYLIATE